MKLARYAGRNETEMLRLCVGSLDADAPSDYRELAGLLACDWAVSRPRRVGIGGGQGAGKSTLGALIESACAFVGLRACVLSLDDFYLTKYARRQLAREIHPLFETRGPPGTHDVELCAEVMARLGLEERVEVPVFDKGRDDRVGERILEGAFDVVVLEGWCVGAAPQQEDALESPVNVLEEGEDGDLRWRRYANQQLASRYGKLWESLDSVVFLRVPDLAAVRRWRGQQEEGLPPERQLDSAGIERFVQHYERVTISMMARSQEFAEITVELAEDHSVAGITFGGRRDRAI